MDLVTGCSGFLARHMIATLRERNVPYRALSRNVAPGVPIIRGDIASSNFDLGGERFRTVYHLAGLAHVMQRGASEAQDFQRVNEFGTQNLLRALLRTGHKPEAVVMASSVAVYGIESGTGLDETTPLRSSAPYGDSKKRAEDHLIEWGREHAVRVAIVRLPLVVGPNAPGNLGALVHAIQRNIYFGVGTGSARRSMVGVKDVCEILPVAAQVGGVFHLTDGYHPRFSELESAIATAMHKRVPRRIPRWAARCAAKAGDAVGWLGLPAPLSSIRFDRMTQTLTFSDAKARRQLEWSPTWVLNQIGAVVS